MDFDYFFNSSQLFKALVTIVRNWIKFTKKDETCHLQNPLLCSYKKFAECDESEENRPFVVCDSQYHEHSFLPQNLLLFLFWLN